ncbi:MAG: tRNA (adenosine(37)-N6)-dimethylallyltransferase MiaA [Bacteroidales bacterium]|nr:tRNA (adenosine(37)-N6)-dimethylallyltransferase MiaA [Bacteroidales bacterium]
MTKTLIILTGPTAIGKSRAAIKIARCLDTEIISADSRQIYRELSIGTAVPSKEELAAVRHHFIQSHSIFQNYNASIFEKEVLALLDLLFKKYDTVLMVGGSMLYIDAVCKGIDTIPDADPAVRETLKSRLGAEGLGSLRMQLKQLDPLYYSETDLKNPARIIHALEICLTSGKPYSSFRSNLSKKRPFKILKTGINCDRKALHYLINKRVDEMVNAGLEDEARAFFEYKNLNALNSVGYREFFHYFEQKISREKAIELIKRDTRRYARKQITWFRNDPEMHWFQPGQEDDIIKLIKENMV